MEKHNVVSMQPCPSDEVTAVLRHGAQHLLAHAIQSEVEELLDQRADRRTEDSRAGVVRNGHRPEVSLQKGLGPDRVRISKVRAKVGDSVTFRSSLVLPWVCKRRSLEAALPRL